MSIFSISSAENEKDDKEEDDKLLLTFFNM
jgi:hypothetical protein